MASQSLYRKWRSQTFGDLVGQDPIVRTLKNALSNGSVAHAYLFSGPRGTGKTSTARLLAKTINCADPVNGEPCNRCQQCREIAAGNSFNVIEIDAASNRGIDSVRDLREKVMMPPSTGKYKVYVLDEAHMLTTEAFNALLKTLEEPPDYVIFVMATTDVHKMLPTVLSRCQRFDFKRITTRQIVEHLIFVAQQEHIHVERSAAELIARAAAGGMRDALSLLDQAHAYSGNEISLAQTQAMLGIADPLAIQKLVASVAQLDSAAVLHLLHELAENGADLRQVNIQVGEYWRALMLTKAGADVATMLDRTEDETREILQMTPLFELEELSEFARIFAQNELVQKSQATPQLGLELACLQSIELHRHARSGTQPVSLLQVHPTPIQAQPMLPQRPLASGISEASIDVFTNGSSTFAGAGDGNPVLSVEIRQAPMAASAHEIASVAVSAEKPALALQQVIDAWEMVKKRVKGRRNKTGIRTAAYLNDYAVVAVEQGSDAAIVVIQAAHKLHYDKLHENREYCADVEWALKLEFDLACRIRLLAPAQVFPQPGSDQVTFSAPPAATNRQLVKQESQALSAQASADGIDPPSIEEDLAAVAKIPVVRENTTIEVPRPSAEVMKQEAGDDPVVQEVVRTFAAKIAEIRLKLR